MANVNARGDLTIIRGDTVRIPMRLTEDDAITGVDLTGSTIRAQVRTEPDGYLAFEFDVLQVDPDDLTAYDLADGEFLLYAANTVTDGLTSSDYVWDCELASAGGIVTTILGPAMTTVIKDVTL